MSDEPLLAVLVCQLQHTHSLSHISACMYYCQCHVIRYHRLPSTAARITRNLDRTTCMCRTCMCRCPRYVGTCFKDRISVNLLGSYADAL
eukprot:jgi/Chrzof1/12114/Cz06g21260.t1